jgi:hypothetical protein
MGDIARRLATRWWVIPAALLLVLLLVVGWESRARMAVVISDVTGGRPGLVVLLVIAIAATVPAIVVFAAWAAGQWGRWWWLVAALALPSACVVSPFARLPSRRVRGNNPNIAADVEAEAHVQIGSALVLGASAGALLAVVTCIWLVLELLEPTTEYRPVRSPHPRRQRPLPPLDAPANRLTRQIRAFALVWLGSACFFSALASAVLPGPGA